MGTLNFSQTGGEKIGARNTIERLQCEQFANETQLNQKLKTKNALWNMIKHIAAS